MAFSDRLAELAKRTKEAEDRSRAAASEARDELRSSVEQASQAAQERADALARRADGAEAKASDWWGQIQSDWARHVAAIREDFTAKKAEHQAMRSKVEADLAADDAAAAIDFAFAAVEEAEYAVLEATLAQMEADEASSSMLAWSGQRTGTRGRVRDADEHASRWTSPILPHRRASKRQKVSAVARVFRVGWHYERLNDELVCRRRGPIRVKGKGEMETWYLQGPRSDDRRVDQGIGSEAGSQHQDRRRGDG